MVTVTWQAKAHGLDIDITTEDPGRLDIRVTRAHDVRLNGTTIWRDGAVTSQQHTSGCRLV